LEADDEWCSDSVSKLLADPSPADLKCPNGTPVKSFVCYGDPKSVSLRKCKTYSCPTSSLGSVDSLDGDGDDDDDGDNGDILGIIDNGSGKKTGYDQEDVDDDGSGKKSGYDQDGDDDDGSGKKSGSDQDGDDDDGSGKKSGYDQDGDGYDQDGDDDDGSGKKNGYDQDGDDDDGSGKKSGYDQDGDDDDSGKKSGYDQDGDDDDSGKKSGYDQDGDDDDSGKKSGYVDEGNTDDGDDDSGKKSLDLTGSPTGSPGACGCESVSTRGSFKCGKKVYVCSFVQYICPQQLKSNPTVIPLDDEQCADYQSLVLGDTCPAVGDEKEARPSVF
jgi:hypothetical protein